MSRYAIFVVLAAGLLPCRRGLARPSCKPTYIFNVLRQVAPVGIAAVGVTYVMILGGVDLSIGAVISLTSVLCAVQMDGDAANLPLALLAACAAGIAIGAVNGVAVAFTRVSPFILTLGTGIAVLGLTQIYSGGTARGDRLAGLPGVLQLQASAAPCRCWRWPFLGSPRSGSSSSAPPCSVASSF